MKTLYINEARGNTLGANTYVYYDKQSLEGVVIDPGVEAETVMKAIDSRKIQLQSILLTHGHFDHTAVVPYIKRKYDVDVYALQEEHVVLLNPNFNASSLIGNPTVTKVDKYLHDGDQIQIGHGSLKVIHTPGHSVGSTCYYDEENRVLFSGDTLFFESIGRTDFHTGDSNAIVSSIKNKLFSLPNNVSVFSGHGRPTTLGHELRHNMHLK